MKSTRRDYVAAVYQVGVNNIIAQHGWTKGGTHVRTRMEL